MLEKEVLESADRTRAAENVHRHFSVLGSGIRKEPKLSMVHAARRAWAA
jgi:hypothetical protein